MKSRYVYAILFGLPGFLVSLLITIIFFSALAGFLWLYLFGDDNWPSYLETLLPILFIITFLLLWIASIVYGYFTGKRLEDVTGLNRKHIVISVAASLLPLALILLYQIRLGNIGEKPLTLRCSEYCLAQGYAMSSMPPRDSGEMLCSCYDDEGTEVLTAPIDVIKP
jgi:hypothetical protein